MAEQNNNDVMIKLPWTVPQQPLVTTQIPVDPQTQKIPLDIQHSTDTTAIWSFLAAMVASIVVAIWYGRKSFELTKQSFDALKDQIDSSERVLLKTNQQLIESQFNQMKWSTNRILKEKEIESYKTGILDFYNIGNELIKLLQTKRVYLGEINIEKIYEINSNESNFHNEYLKLSNELELVIMKVTLDLERSEENHSDLLDHLNQIQVYVTEIIKDIYPTTVNLIDVIGKLSSIHKHAYIRLLDRYRKEKKKIKAA